MKLYPRFWAVLLIASILLIGLVSVLQAQTDPVFFDLKIGNAATECAQLGYSFGWKFDPPVSQTVYPFGNSHYITILVDADGKYFDWESSFGIDKVSAKGGNGANIYTYNEGTSGTDLHAPNNSSGQPAGLSHITFCWDYEALTSSKTALTEWNRTYTWTIDKSVDDNSHAGFKGDSFSSGFKVEVTLETEDSDWRIYGTITINNPNPIDVPFTIEDVIDDGVGEVIPDCSASTIPANGSIDCDYSVSLSDEAGSLNTATISTLLDSGVEGTSAIAEINWGDPNPIGYPTINVEDTNGESWEFSASGTEVYSEPYSCNENNGNNTNRATIVETGLYDEEVVNVACYELNVLKNAHTVYTRDYDWSISKTADQTNLILATGEPFSVNYTVTATATGFTDKLHTVYGSIEVANPAPFTAKLDSVSDAFSGSFGSAQVTCPVSFPYDLPEYSTLVCTYTSGNNFANFSSSSTGTNTATATLINNDGSYTNFSGSTDFDFADAQVGYADHCINLSDSLQGILGGGEICVDFTKTTSQVFEFKYTRTLVFAECGPKRVENIASYTTNSPSGEPTDTGSDDHLVTVNIPCATGCTLTQGYWKTHSDRGPAPYDDTWQLVKLFGQTLPSGLEEATPFFLSGKTWYQVFWTPPAGNPYYNLAHQYMAAKLNILNGASTTPAVLTAIANAEAFFAAYAPNYNFTKAQKTSLTQWASTLDGYNNGRLGIPHCSEQTN